MKLKILLTLLLTVIVSLIVFASAVSFSDVEISKSFHDSFGTGIGVSEKGIFIPTATPNLTIGQTQSVKYSLENKVANTSANVRVILKLDSLVIEDYFAEITTPYTKTTNLLISGLACNSVHTLTLEVQDSNLEDNDVVHRNIIVSCGTPAPICGDGVKDNNEQCDVGEQNGVLCTAEYNGFCEYCSDFCEFASAQGPYCGDGIVNQGYEICDDGNIINDDGCPNSCKGVFVEHFQPVVWQCGYRIMTDEDVQPWRFSGQGDLLYERAGNYLFEGEKIKVDVVVFDKNKVDSANVDLIMDSNPGTVESVEDADYSVNCVEIEQVNFDKCNARIGEEKITKFDPETMQAYECSITILDSEHMYCEYWLTVLAESGLVAGNSGIYDEMTPLWINPLITLNVEGKLNFDNLRPGTTSYSKITIQNDAQGGVGLDMFITGKNWPSVTTGNLGRCANVDSSGKEIPNELVDYIPLGAFRYYAENGAFTTRLDKEVDNNNYDSSTNRDVDDEGYVNIQKQLNAGFEEAMFDEAEIIQAGGPVVKGYGYRANVLNSGGLMSLTFKLNLPESCYGDFESPEEGSIFIWGEAI